MPQGIFHAITIHTALGPVDITVLAWESGSEITGMAGDCLPNVRFEQGVEFLERVACWPGLWGQIDNKIKMAKHEEN